MVGRVHILVASPATRARYVHLRQLHPWPAIVGLHGRTGPVESDPRQLHAPRVVAPVLWRRSMQLRSSFRQDVHLAPSGILLAVMSLAGVLGPVGAMAQAFSPYSDFQALALADMDSLRVKLTYGGPQDALLATLVIAKTGTSAGIAAFTPFRRAGFEYSNDDGPIGTATATTQELKGIIDSVGSVSRVTDGDMDPKGYVSFALLSTSGGTTKVF